MPEGPPIFYLKEKLKVLEGDFITEISIPTIPPALLLKKMITRVDAYGKNLIICVADHFLTIHLGMDGEMQLNERAKATPNFSLTTDKNSVHGYLVRATIYNSQPEDVFNWKTDIMSEKFEAAYILQFVKRKYANQQIVDTLMNQQIFTGVGNIIKNEVLFRCKIHPESINNMIPAEKLLELINDCKTFGYIFYERLKEGDFYERTDVYDKKICPAHKTPLRKYIYGKDRRVNFICEKCQKLYKVHQPEIFD